jgi:uncharacterized delta-60 repeat protein
MARVRVMVLVTCVALVAAAPASASPGDLDPGFGDGGIVQVSGTEVVLQAGTIVVGRTGSVVSERAWMEAVRLLPDGTLDPTFGSGGRARAMFAGSAYAEDLAARPRGKIVIAGTRAQIEPWRSVIAVARFRADGTLDDTFGGDGKVTTSFPGFPEARAVALQPNGRIVVAGTDGPDFVLVRYLRTGALDPSFGIRGRVTTVLPRDTQTAVAEDLAIDPDGRIVVVGTLSWRTIVVARYLPNGKLDPTFGRGDGLKFTGGTRKSGLTVALQPDGKIVVCGYEEVWNRLTQELDSYLIATRYTQTGRPDTDFGVVRIAPAVWGADYGVVLQPDDRIVVVGDGVLARLMTDGSLDPSFGGGDGVVDPTFNLEGVTLQPDGRIVVIGGALARFLA